MDVDAAEPNQALPRRSLNKDDAISADVKENVDPTQTQTRTQAVMQKQKQKPTPLVKSQEDMPVKERSPRRVASVSGTADSDADHQRPGLVRSSTWQPSPKRTASWSGSSGEAGAGGTVVQGQTPVKQRHGTRADSRTYNQILTEYQYLLGTLQQQDTRIRSLLTALSAVQAQLPFAPTPTAARQLRKEAGFKQSRIATAEQQERLIALRLGDVWVELHARDRLRQHEQQQQQRQQQQEGGRVVASPLSLQYNIGFPSDHAGIAAEAAASAAPLTPFVMASPSAAAAAVAAPALGPCGPDGSMYLLSPTMWPMDGRDGCGGSGSLDQPGGGSMSPVNSLSTMSPLASVFRPIAFSFDESKGQPNMRDARAASKEGSAQEPSVVAAAAAASHFPAPVTAAGGGAADGIVVGCLAPDGAPSSLGSSLNLPGKCAQPTSVARAEPTPTKLQFVVYRENEAGIFCSPAYPGQDEPTETKDAEEDSGSGGQGGDESTKTRQRRSSFHPTTDSPGLASPKTRRMSLPSVRFAWPEEPV